MEEATGKRARRFGIHKIVKNTVATLSYVGSKGTHLARGLDFNQLHPVPLSANPYKAGEPIGAGGHDDCTADGVILGTLAYETMTVGRLGHLLIWIAPHGVTELSGLILSGAAGYAMGWALIVPGRRKRGAALKEAGKDAIVVLCTAVVLMFIAAPVEGFFSFNPNVPDALKIAFAGLAAAAWAVFWIGYGREPENISASPTAAAPGQS